MYILINNQKCQKVNCSSRRQCRGTRRWPQEGQKVDMAVAASLSSTLLSIDTVSVLLLKAMAEELYRVPALGL